METQIVEHKPAPHRTRNVTMTIRASREEKDFIMRKMERSGAGNFNTYALKMLVCGEVKNVDLTHYRELAKEVSRVGVCINQIAKTVNSTDSIYKSEVADLQRYMEEIWQLLRSSLSEQR